VAHERVHQGLLLGHQRVPECDVVVTRAVAGRCQQGAGVPEIGDVRDRLGMALLGLKTNYFC
jgi:hypothetical protein